MARKTDAAPSIVITLVYVTSPDAPEGRVLMGKTVSDRFNLWAFGVLTLGVSPNQTQVKGLRREIAPEFKDQPGLVPLGESQDLGVKIVVERASKKSQVEKFPTETERDALGNFAFDYMPFGKRASTLLNNITTLIA